MSARFSSSTEYGAWADWLEVPRHTFSAMFGAVIARGQDYREVFQHFQPGFDLKEERQRRLEAGRGEFFDARDLYPDVRPCLAELKRRGFFVGVAGNQTSRAGRFLRDLNLGADLIATSDDWGAEKPSHAFFDRLVEAVGLRPSQIVYVGDRLENDILPAIEVGLLTAHIRRGPWGFQQVDSTDRQRVDITLDSLAELPDKVGALESSRRTV